MHLIWLVTLPGQMPVNITFDGDSNLTVPYNIDTNITATLTAYVAEEYIESIFVLTVLTDVLMNETQIECRIANLDNSTMTVFVNMSGMANCHFF